MERIIVKNTLKFLKEHIIIRATWFLGRQINCNQSIGLSEILDAFCVNKQSVAIAYTEFAKAFDNVSHSNLRYRLRAYGVSGNLLKWIENLLMGRSQCNRVGESDSSFISITSGVIQGSCTGPLLFILYVNDIADLFDNGCLCKLYADDLKLYTSVSTVVDLENP